MGKKSRSKNRPALRMAHAPDIVVRQGIIDSVTWPDGMPDSTRHSLAYILAQLLAPIRETLMKMHEAAAIPSAALAADEQPKAASAAISSAAGAADEQQAAPAATSSAAGAADEQPQAASATTLPSVVEEENEEEEEEEEEVKEEAPSVAASSASSVKLGALPAPDALPASVASASVASAASASAASASASASDIPFVEVDMDNMVFNLQAEDVQKKAVFVEVEAFTKRLEAYTQAAITATLKHVPNLITGIAEKNMAPSALPTPGALPGMWPSSTPADEGASPAPGALPVPGALPGIGPNSTPADEVALRIHRAQKEKERKVRSRSPAPKSIAVYYPDGTKYMDMAWTEVDRGLRLMYIKHDGFFSDKEGPRFVIINPALHTQEACGTL